MNELRKERNREYFIEITCDLIRKEGMEAATIRNIAKLAGYNSATLYSYFDNQAHLIFCAYMRFEEEVLTLMKEQMKKSKLTYLQMWPKIYVLLADYYFKNPNIFECSYVVSYDANGGKARQKKREEISALTGYLMNGFNEIEKESGIPGNEIIRLHGVCFSLMVGTVLLALKERIGDPSEETLQQLEKNIYSILDHKH